MKRHLKLVVRVCVILPALAGFWQLHNTLFMPERQSSRIRSSSSMVGSSSGERTNSVEHHSTRQQANQYTGTRFRDEYFEPILATFRNPSAFAIKTHFRSGNIPKVFFVASESRDNMYWKESFRQFTEKECPLPCTITDDSGEIFSSDAILIYLKHIRSLKQLQRRLPNRDLSQPWIVHSNETPVMSSYHKISYKSLDGIFNRTMHFRRDADIAWTHGFIVSKEDAIYLPASWRREAPAIKKKPFNERRPIAIFTSNCSPKGGRKEYIAELSKHIEVDIYGRCGSLKCATRHNVGHKYRVGNDPCVQYLAQNYLFYLSFENNICLDYATEKVFNIQYYPVIPIVYGGADYSKLLPPNSYIDALQFSPKQLADLLKTLAADEAMYEARLEWRNDFLVSSVGYWRILCQLCTKLYDPEFYEEKHYDQFHDWFVTKSKCRAFHAATNTTEILQIP